MNDSSTDQLRYVLDVYWHGKSSQKNLAAYLT